MKPKPSQSSVSRRQFNKTASAAMGALAGFHFFPALSDNKLGKPTVVGIGAGRKGYADINGASNAGFEVIGLVDVIDSTKLAKLDGRFRKMGQTRQHNE